MGITIIYPSDVSVPAGNTFVGGEGTYSGVGEDSDSQVSIFRDGTGVISYSSDATGFLAACTAAVSGDVIRLGTIALDLGTDTFALADGVSLIGCGANATTITSDPTGSQILYLTGGNEVRGLQLVNTHSAGTKRTINTNTTGDNILQSIQITSSNGAECINVTSTGRFTLQDSLITAGRGILCASGCTVIVRDCVINSNKASTGKCFTNSGGTILVTNSILSTVSGTHFDTASGNTYYGFCVKPDGGAITIAGAGTTTNLAPAVALDDLTDVSAAAPNDGEALYTTDGTTWSPLQIDLTLEDLADVSITSIDTGEALVYSGGDWVNGAVGITGTYPTISGIIKDITTANGVITQMVVVEQITAGSGTWTRPAGVTSALVELWGAGAAGDTSGNGGGGGGYTQVTSFTDSSATYAFGGGNLSFDTGTYNASYGSGTVAGAGTGGDINQTGGAGGAGNGITTTGGGGGGAGPSGDGTAGSVADPGLGGAGGGTGAGAGGNGGGVVAPSDGIIGNNYGGGGGGCIIGQAPGSGGAAFSSNYLHGDSVMAQTKVTATDFALNQGQQFYGDSGNLESELQIYIDHPGTGIIPYSSDATGFLAAAGDAVSGDCIILGAITLDLTTSSFSLADGVSLIGSGKNATVIQSASIGPILCTLNDQNVVRDITIRNSTGSAASCQETGTDTATLINCNLIGEDAGNGFITNGNLFANNCLFSSGGASSGLFGGSGATTLVQITNCQFISAGGDGITIPGSNATVYIVCNSIFTYAGVGIAQTSGVSAYYGLCTQADGSEITTSGVCINITESSNLESLQDTNITFLTTGDFLTYDNSSTKWINTPHTLPINLDDVANVTIAAPATNQALVWSGSAWVNGATPAADNTYTDIVSLDIENGFVTAVT